MFIQITYINVPFIFIFLHVKIMSLNMSQEARSYTFIISYYT